MKADKTRKETSVGVGARVQERETKREKQKVRIKANCHEARWGRGHGTAAKGSAVRIPPILLRLSDFEEQLEIQPTTIQYIAKKVRKTETRKCNVTLHTQKKDDSTQARTEVETGNVSLRFVNVKYQ